jgi:hypothetical protein
MSLLNVFFLRPSRPAPTLSAFPAYIAVNLDGVGIGRAAEPFYALRRASSISRRVPNPLAPLAA